MSDDVPRVLIDAIDAEIALVNEKRRLEGLTSWALGAATIVLLAQMAALVEAGHLRWSNIIALCLSITLFAHVLVTLFTLGSLPAESRAPFRLLSFPPTAALLQRLFLLLLVLALHSYVSVILTIVSAATFILGSVGFALLQPAIAQRLSLKPSIQMKWSRDARVLHDAGVSGVIFVTRWVLPLVYCALAFGYARAAYAITQGESLRDVRFAVASVLLMSLLGMALQQGTSFALHELKSLRSAVAFERISRQDGEDAFAAILAGASGASDVIMTCRGAIMSLQAFQSERSDLLHPNEDRTLSLRKFMALDAEIVQVLTLAKASASTYEILRPDAAPHICKVIAELDEQHNHVRAWWNGASGGGGIESDA